jgi:hypothetical protein
VTQPVSLPPLMGSSKKHKEKDREHKRKRKHRSRDRSRSGSREKRHRDRDGKDRERHGEKRRRLESDGDEQVVRVPSHVDYEEGAAASARSPSPVAAKRAASEEEGMILSFDLIRYFEYSLLRIFE